MAPDAFPNNRILRLCRGLPCEMAGARRLAMELGHPAQTQTRRCLGHCEHAPAACLGDAVLAPATYEGIGRALDDGPLPVGEHAPVEYVDYQTYRADGGYASLERRPWVHTDAEALLAKLKQAGLPGPDDEPALGATLVVDVVAQREGDFRDRALLELDPHRVIEGAVLAAAAFGTTRIELRLAQEFQACHEVLEEEIEQFHQELPVAGLPRVQVQRGAAGGNVRTTLMEAETLYWLREVWERGATAFAGSGRRGLKGMRAVAVSGRVAKPGLKLVPAGCTVREIVDVYAGGMAAGSRFAGFLAGVPFGAAHADRVFDDSDLAPHGGDASRGALVVLDERDLPLVEREGLR